MDALVTHSVTHFTAVPTLLQALLPYLQGGCQSKAQADRVTAPMHNTASTTPSGSSAFTGPATLSAPKAHTAHMVPTTLSNSEAALSQEKCLAGDASPGSTSADSGVNNQGTGEALVRLRVVVSSGEAMSVQLACSLQKVLPTSCRLLNLYGSTEVAADCTCCDITHLAQRALLPAPGEECMDLDTGAAVNHMTTSTLHTADIPVQQHQNHADHSLKQSSISQRQEDSTLSQSGYTGSCADIPQLCHLHGSADEQVNRGASPDLQHHVAAGWPIAGFAVCILQPTDAMTHEQVHGQAQAADAGLQHPSQPAPHPHGHQQTIPNRSAKSNVYTQLHKPDLEASLPDVKCAQPAAKERLPQERQLGSKREGPNSYPVQAARGSATLLHPQSEHAGVTKRPRTTVGDSPTLVQQTAVQLREAQAAHAVPSHISKPAAQVQLCEEGQQGEIAVAGVSLASGYHRYAYISAKLAFHHLECSCSSLSGWTKSTCCSMINSLSDACRVNDAFYLFDSGTFVKPAADCCPVYTYMCSSQLRKLSQSQLRLAAGARCTMCKQWCRLELQAKV